MEGVRAKPLRKLRATTLLAIAIILTNTGKSQVLEYQVTGDLYGSVAGQVQDVGNTSGFDLGNVPTLYAPLNMGNIIDTIYFDPGKLTVRQVVSVSPQSPSTSTLTEIHTAGGQNLSGTLTIFQGLSALTYDTGTFPVVWNPTTSTYTYPNQGFYTFVGIPPVNGTYSLEPVLNFLKK